jgi:anthranilate phosphoribosyltransferase
MVAGLQLAQKALESGAALSKLNELVAFGASASPAAV